MPKVEYECLNCDKTTKPWPLIAPASTNGPPVAHKSGNTPIPPTGQIVAGSMPHYDIFSSKNNLMTELVTPDHIQFYPDSKEGTKTMNDDGWKDGMLDTAPKSPVLPVVRGAAVMMPIKSKPNSVFPRTAVMPKRLNGMMTFTSEGGNSRFSNGIRDKSSSFTFFATNITSHDAINQSINLKLDCPILFSIQELKGFRFFFKPMKQRTNKIKFFLPPLCHRKLLITSTDTPYKNVSSSAGFTNAFFRGCLEWNTNLNLIKITK